jgi:hypothetical protein
MCTDNIACYVVDYVTDVKVSDRAWVDTLDLFEYKAVDGALALGACEVSF